MALADVSDPKSFQRGSGARLATAFHEAGHAVIAHVLHHRVKSVSIEPAESWSGIVRFKSRLSARGMYNTATGSVRLRAEELTLISLAGPRAQRRHRPSSWRHFHGGGDYNSVADLAIAMSGSERSANALIRWLEVRTDDLLELHWAAVEAVASALITKHILDAKEFIEAFELAKFPTRE